MFQLNAIYGYDVGNLLNGNFELARVYAIEKHHGLSVAYSRHDATGGSIVKVRFHVATHEA